MDNKPKFFKTGTTIVGVIFKDGVILGADTRATAGSLVMEKRCEKIHKISKFMYCCGAGTAADCDYVTRMISSDIELHGLETNTEKPPVVLALTLVKRYLFQYQGHVSAALILGGVDKQGSHLYQISPHGSICTLPFVSMGSGSLAAMAILESRFKANMELEEAKKLVRDAIAAGVFNDLGSGNNIDLCVIKQDKVDYHRHYETPNARPHRQGNYKYQKGSTAVLKTTRIPLEVVSTTIQTEVPMEE